MSTHTSLHPPTPRGMTSRGHLSLLAFFALLTVALPSLCQAAIATIPASKDNTLYQNAAGSTSNGAGEYMFTGRTSDSFVRRAVIRFDVAASIPAGATINSVTLQLRVSRVKDSISRTTSLHRLVADWGEGTSNSGQNEGQGAPATTGDATWIHRFYPSTSWSAAGGDFNATASASLGITGTGTYAWTSATMILDVQGWLATPASNFGWLIRGDESIDETAKRLNTRENGTTSTRPMLIVDYTPAGGTTGACCLPGGNCTVTDSPSCASQGGTYLGDDTTCSPNPCGGGSVTVTLSALKDNTLYEDATGSLSNGVGEFFFSGRTNGLRRRAVLAFAVADSIPAGAVVSAATLTLRTTSGGGTSNVSLHRALAGWGEGTSDASGDESSGAPSTTNDATWIHRFYNTQLWTAAGGDYASTASATTAVADQAFYTWSGAGVASDIQGWLNNPTTNFGWLIVGVESGNSQKRYASRHYAADITFRPKLQITYTVGPPTPAGACCFSNGVCDTLSAADCSSGGGTYQGDGTTCSEGLCPLVLTPFVDSLVVPPLAVPTSGTQGGVATYDIGIVEFKKKLHRDLPPTTVWGYDSLYPGPTILATPGNPVTVKWSNDLRDSTGALRTEHYLPVDLCMHGPDTEGAGARVVTHLHGGHVPPSVDGYPDSTYNPGQSRTYVYPNNQQASLIWYHDHAIGITRLNVMMGLAGGYVITDSVEAALNLPSGPYDVPLVLQDRSFNPDGSLAYPAVWDEHFFGDFAVVNGTVWPYMNVRRGAYRLRLLGGSNSRAWMLKMSNGAPFVVIGGDGGLLERPVVRDSLLLTPGERIDTIVDFSPYAPGTEIILQNSAPAPYPSGDPMHVLPQIMKFVVQSQSGYTFTPPPTLRATERLQEADAAEHRDFVLQKMSEPCAGQMWMINGLGFDDITEYPRLGSTEVWRFINRSGAVHPMHMHLVMFQVLDRTPVTFVGDSTVFGTPVPPDSSQRGWKDTVPVLPNEAVRVIARFEDYTGRYPYHCHILEHEDHEMMRQFEVVADTATSVPSVSQPGVVTLLPSQPNPTKDAVWIQFDLPREGRTHVEVFDVTGRRVIDLVDRVAGPGHERVLWDGRGESGDRVASGVYLYRLSVNGYESQYGKLTIMK